MWELIKGGEVETIKIGRRRLVIFASLESLIARNRVEVNHDDAVSQPGLHLRPSSRVSQTMDAAAELREVHQRPRSTDHE